MLRIVVLVFLLFLQACSSLTAANLQVCFNDQCIDAEVARTAQERSRGLQFRKSLGEREGMLFIFPSSQPQSFWMKDTYIPLDIIWMDQHRRIVFIIPNILPCETDQCPVYTPDSEASYVLEVNAGVSADMGLSVGNQAVF